MNRQNIYKNEQNLGTGSSNDLTLQDYFIILKIHWKKISIITLLSFLTGLYYTYSIPPQYNATATVEIREKPEQNVVLDFSGNRNQNKLTNEIQVIKSRALSMKVVEELWNSKRRNNLHVFGTRIYYPKGQNIRSFIKEFLTLGLYDATLIKPKKYDIPYDESIGYKYSDIIRNNIAVANVRNTNILQISFSSPNADEARRVANIIAKTYIAYDIDRSKQAAKRSLLFLDNLVAEQEQKIEEKEKKVRDFKLLNNMYSLDGDASSIITQLNSYEGELFNINAELNIIKEKTGILNSKLTEKEKTLTEALINNINNQLITLRMEIGRLENQIVQGTNTYGENHSAVLELKDKLKGLKSRLDEKVTLLINQGMTVQDPLQYRQDLITQLLNLDAEMISYQLRQSEINKMITFFSKKLNDLPDKQMELARLTRDADILNQNYSFLRSKLEEAKLNVAVQAGNAVLLDGAKRPSNPIGPNHNRNILLASFLGLGLALLISFSMEFLDNTLKTIDEIEKYDLSVLGIIPAIGKPVKNKKRRGNKLNIIDSSLTLKRRLITKEDPKSPISEAYRSLRTSMLFSSSKKVRSILVSSAGPGEGKTTTVANLAITYANLGKKTILVDTDLRRPVVHKVFNLEREPGVTNFLAGQTEDISTLIKETEVDNLSIITSGVIPPNPSEMLGSHKMIDLVKTLEHEWDMVLFDSPPLVAVTDANMFSQEIDTIVLVVKVGQTDKKAFQHTISNLRNINAPLSGIIMNAVTNKSSYGSYYYYYYHQYYNYYGSEQDS